jgi:hypothetical protein
MPGKCRKELPEIAHPGKTVGASHLFSSILTKGEPGIALDPGLLLGLL